MFYSNSKTHKIERFKGEPGEFLFLLISLLLLMAALACSMLYSDLPSTLVQNVHKLFYIIVQKD